MSKKVVGGGSFCWDSSGRHGNLAGIAVPGDAGFLKVQDKTQNGHKQTIRNIN